MLCQFLPVGSKDLNLVLNMDIKVIICIKVVNSSMQTTLVARIIASV